jgi:hypothetical protein
MDIEQAERAARARADLITAIVLAVLGLIVVYASWTMPRLEARHIHPATIPGLVPFLLGIALTICAAILGLQAVRIDAPGGWRHLAARLTGPEAGRVVVALALVLTYSLVLLGRMPFWLASGLFIFAFIIVFEVLLSVSQGSTLRKVLWGLAIAVVAGAGIAYVFQMIFLVRLP